MGEFDKSFLSVPAECLTTSMKTHQKCFSLRHGKKLSNHFLLVTNQKAKDGGTIVAGNEKVIAARLSDAKFFWEKDLKKKLEIMRDELKGITFHEKLGTQFERAERIKELARRCSQELCEAAPAQRAAELAKADLVSGMVGEFPELQGLMGRYYAEAEHMNPAIARAIELHYKPKGPTDSYRWKAKATAPRSPSHWPTSSTCWWASGPSARSQPARATPTNCAAPHWASSASSSRTTCASPSSTKSNKRLNWF